MFVASSNNLSFPLLVFARVDVVSTEGVRKSGGEEGDGTDDEESEGQVTMSEIAESDLSVSAVTDYVIKYLGVVKRAIRNMLSSMNSMREGCLPFIFYHRLAVL